MTVLLLQSTSRSSARRVLLLERAYCSRRGGRREQEQYQNLVRWIPQHVAVAPRNRVRTLFSTSSSFTSCDGGAAGRRGSYYDRYNRTKLHSASASTTAALIPGPIGIPSRAQQVERLQGNGKDKKNEEYDVLVIGGGAVGAGIALDGASRGLRVACIERGDFASETSSRSTKLIWAGIKYMAAAIKSLSTPSKVLTQPIKTWKSFASEMYMVLECHRERRYMTVTQKHLCHWVPIAVPFTTWFANPPPLGHAAFCLFPLVAPAVFKAYDALSGFACPASYVMSARTAERKFPQLTADGYNTTNDDTNKKTGGLKYCSVFYEAMHNDSRTNLAIAMSAAEHGAHIANYVEMIDMIRDDEEDSSDNDNNKVVGIKALDRTTGKVWEIRAKKIVLAGGPFTDDMRAKEPQQSKNEDYSSSQEEQTPAVQGAAGTHIVLPGSIIPKNMGLLDYNTSDGRFMFILPWLGHTLIGTTDKKCPAETLHNPPQEEVDWLLNEGQKYLKPKLDRSLVLSAWRGWRPLAADPHATAAGDGDDPEASRDHVVSENPSTGVVFVAGGKWTTWRQMAQDVVDRICDKENIENIQPCSTLKIKLHGGQGYSNNKGRRDLVDSLVQRYGLDSDIALHLVETYGARADEVCRASHIRDRLVPDGGHAKFPYIEAEVVYACREYACTVEDVISRRTRLAFLNQKVALDTIPAVARIMQREFRWSDEEMQRQVETARYHVASYAGISSTTTSTATTATTTTASPSNQEHKETIVHDDDVATRTAA